MKKIIPVMHCFDNNYVIPAIVSFYSMLDKASKDYEYKLYVLHTDITAENQQKLQEAIAGFDNASLEFINMNNRFDELWKNLVTKGHYSKEMFYKFVPPSIFPQYDKIIITDVDVVWAGDISKSFFLFDADDDYYLAGVNCGCKKNSYLEECINNYKKEFTAEEIAKLKFGAGYLIFNLKKMRQDNIEQKFVDYLEINAPRLKQPEQDVINIICSDKALMLPLNSMVCTYLFDLYKNDEDKKCDYTYSAKELTYAMNNPIQLHYATVIKPWLHPSICTKSEEWFNVLLKTPFFGDWLEFYVKSLDENEWKKIFDLPCIVVMGKGKKKCLKFFGFKILSWKKKK